MNQSQHVEFKKLDLRGVLCFHLINIQEQTKLIFGGRNYKNASGEDSECGGDHYMRDGYMGVYTGKNSLSFTLKVVQFYYISFIKAFEHKTHSQ